MTVQKTPAMAQAAEEETYGHYSMVLEWDPEDHIYVVTVPELPGCQAHGSTYEEAARKGREAIVTWVDGARHFGDLTPRPATGGRTVMLRSGGPTGEAMAEQRGVAGR